MKHSRLLVVAAMTVVAACDGFKEAMTAHVDVVARAGSQELSVTRLAELLGNSKVPLRKDVAKAVAELWVNYQLLGSAAAHGDSLANVKAIDDAMWSQIAQAKAAKWHDVISKSWSAPDSSANESRYNQGEMLAAKHILFMVPPSGLSTAAKDSIRRKAEAVQKQATPANFGQLAQQYSMDPGSKARGGSLGVFPRGVMVPEFEKALVALKPGQISPVVQTQFGYHILYRQPYSEVKDEFASQANERGSQVAESTYLAKLEQSGNIQVKPNAATVVRGLLDDLAGHRDDKTVIATTKYGDFTAGRMAQWIAAFPPQAQLPQQLRQQPDSVIPIFVKKIVGNELVLHQADSAKVTIDSGDLAQIRGGFRGMVSMAWTGLGIDPKTLADSARTPAERERVASSRIEDYLDRLLAAPQGGVQFVDIPAPLETVLHSKYDSKVNDAGLDRAVERATKVRAAMDSTRASQAPPPSAVPMPGGAQGQRPQMPNAPPQSPNPAGATRKP